MYPMLDMHTHHYRCSHASGTLEEYIEAAIAKKMTYIGLSDHAPLLDREMDEHFGDIHMAPSALEDCYLEMRRLKKKYSHEINVLIGLEVDYIPGLESTYEEFLKDYTFDYLIGAVHYFNGYHIFDPRRWKKNTDIVGVYKNYFHHIQQAAMMDLFDSIAHLDAITAWGVLPCRRVLNPLIQNTLEVIQVNSKTVEINTSGLRKCNEPFPFWPIIEELHQLQVPLTFGSDAHSPEEVGYGWRDVQKRMKEVGIEELAIYEERRQKMIGFQDI